MKRVIPPVVLTLLSSCAAGGAERNIGENVVPAIEFSNAVQQGKAQNYSIFKGPANEPEARAQMMAEKPSMEVKPLSAGEMYRAQGFELKKSLQAPQEIAEPQRQAPAPLPGSSAPYYTRQMVSNPSLWPDESSGTFLFRDLRAFQPMDILSITINENTEGRKQAETDSQSQFSLVAAIENFFGKETRWISNNAGLDPENLINATTNSNFQGQGQTRRIGQLRAMLSAVVLEVLPNGLLRIEGSKIVSVDREEEVMVISGLVRPRDIDSQNKVDSSRIANMRIDFYGRGVVGETTFPGWGARLIRYLWPF